MVIFVFGILLIVFLCCSDIVYLLVFKSVVSCVCVCVFEIIERDGASGEKETRRHV